MNDVLLSLIATLQGLVLLLSAQIDTPNQDSQILIDQVAAIVVSLSEEIDVLQDTPKESFTTINSHYGEAVVNIICKGSGKFKSGTATGVIISPTGMILTNAHMAQYMLLGQATTAPVSCVIRTGSPAVSTYKAAVVYIPPSWVEENAHQIADTKQSGTGEDDYALLQIVSHVDDSVPLPQEFTYIKPNTSLLSTQNGQEALIRAYPAEFVGSATTLHSLRPVGSVTSISTIATFVDTEIPTDKTRDLISLGGTIVAQGGSSGGAVIDDSGKLIGLVVTSTRNEETKDRDLRAITLSHINTSIERQSSKDIAEFTTTPLHELIEEFGEQLLESAGAFADVYNQ